MKKLLLVFSMVLVTGSLIAWSGTQTFRDSQGRLQGTATTDRYGKTTYRDAQGRLQGTKTVK